MEEPNPSEATFDWEEHERQYPKQNSSGVEGRFPRPADGLDLTLGQCITDIPLEQRHRYMWLVPDDMKDHPCYKENDWGGRIIRENQERIQKEEDDKKAKDKDKDDKIEMLLKYVADLGKQVNELTKQMKK